MTPATVLFLDVLRIMAAGCVFIEHGANFWNERLSAVLIPIAHKMVIVFFVLSGYVIAHVAFATPKPSPGQFVIARLTRLYSVLIPGLVLMLTLQLLGSWLNPTFYDTFSRGFDGIRYALTFFYLQSIWVFSAAPPTNIPLWSLSYEFWYYAMFAAAVFMPTRRLKLIGVALGAVIAGPDILLLLPCWLFGVAACLCPRDTLLGRQPARWVLGVAWIVALLATLAIGSYITDFPLPVGSPRLYFSAAFASDWLLAVAIAVSIHLFNSAALPAPPRTLLRLSRRVADQTFALYLYHYPLIVFVTATVPFDPSSAWQMASVVAVIGAAIFALGVSADNFRPHCRRFLERACGRMLPGRAETPA